MLLYLSSAPNKTPRSFSLEIDKKLSSFPIKRLLSLWSPALDFCLLANGKIESVIVNSDGETFEVTSGKLIAKEAGAVLTDYKGNPKNDDSDAVFVMSSTKEVHGKILTTL